MFTRKVILYKSNTTNTNSPHIITPLQASPTRMGQKQSASRARSDSHGQNSTYFLGWEEYEKNPYHPATNPHGIIQMGLAENQLSFDILESWLAVRPSAACFARDGVSVFRELALFQDYHGYPPFKTALARFMEKIGGNKVRFDPDRLVLTAGATSANEILMFCLAEPGDTFLLPTPYYPGFDRDLKWRTGVDIAPVSSSSPNGFRITRNSLEEAYNRARKQKKRVKGILISNPSNPLGTTMPRADLEMLLEFVAEKRIHLVSDEIYCGTVFDSPDFISVLEVMEGKGENVARHVHVVYSLSKDLGLPGFRAGAIYSGNEMVTGTATKMSSFGLVSSQTQYLLSEMLADEALVSEYVAENRRRLKRRRDMMVAGLCDAGIGCLEGNGGLFCWVDMRHLIEGPRTLEGEKKLWMELLHGARLNVTPGSACHCEEVGWFRLCFANVTEETLRVAMERLKSSVGGMCGHRVTESATRSSMATRIYPYLGGQR